MPPIPDDAVARWRLDLSRIGDRDALLHYEDLPTGTLDLATAHPGGLAQLLAGRPTRLSSLFREPAAHAAARRSARAIRGTVSELADEHGLDAGRLAVGLVTWRSPRVGDVVAPVLLRPLVLRPRGAGQTDDDIDLGDEVTVNPALVRLLARHGVFVDPAELRGLAAGEHGFAPRPALDRLRELTAAVDGLTVQDRTVVGAFVDLAPSLVAELDRIAGHLVGHPERMPLVSALAHGRALAPPPSAPRHAEEPIELLDLDPDQRAVVRDVVAGASVSVHAAPGAGTTQLAAAIVSTLAGSGRRTLLLAPQRTELTDVRDRLAALGLSSLVHEPGAAVERPVPAATAVEARPRDAALRAVERAREALLARDEALRSERRPGGASVISAVEELTRLSASSPAPRTTVRLPDDALGLLGPAELTEAAAALAEAASLGAVSDSSRGGPWDGAALASEDEARRLVESTRRLHGETLPSLRTTMARLAADAGLSGGTSVTEWRRQVDLLVAVRATLDVLRPAVYERSLVELITAAASSGWRAERGLRMGALERRRLRRQARDLVRPGSDPGDLHGALLRAQAERLAWQRAASGGGPPRVPTGLGPADTALEDVATALGHLDRALAATPSGGGLLDAGVDDLASRLAALVADPDAADRVPRRAALLGRLSELALTGLLDDLVARKVDGAEVAAELRLAWWASALASALRSDPALRRDPALTADTDPGRDLAAAVGRLREAEVARVCDADAARPRPSATLLSPLALTHLPAADEVDVVVLLGAHRWGVAEAVLAFARGRQAVVIGDPSGLPPSVIRLGPDLGGDDEPPPAATTSARTSLLSAVTGVLPVRRLRHQHRMPAPLASLHALVTGHARPGAALPSPDAGATFSVDLVPDGTGVPDAAGGVESLDVEVQHVVRRVLEHVRARPLESLAVLAVGRRHARRVAEALRAELPDHPDVADFFTRPGSEPFVVTDLTRSEDAVRDAVILTVGFGRTPHGRVVHRFGVLDSTGGDALLGVGLSRARRRLTVVSCLAAGDLDPERLRTPGARALRAALAGPDADAAPAPGDPRSPLLLDLARRLESAGLTVRGGSGGIDLVVTGPAAGPGPEHGATAVLVDLPDAADDSDPDALVERHVARPAALQQLGWRVARVGALALFTDPDSQVAAIRATVDA
ncbi:MAG TPA: hypothetical protein VFD41_04200 [Actinomycetales bacterium]|nr:hypothetical protein [Actinomycetales bacterium]